MLPIVIITWLLFLKNILLIRRRYIVCQIDYNIVEILTYQSVFGTNESVKHSQMVFISTTVELSKKT